MLKVMLLMMKRKKNAQGANNFLSYPKAPKNIWEEKKIRKQGKRKHLETHIPKWQQWCSLDDGIVEDVLGFHCVFLHFPKFL